MQSQSDERDDITKLLRDAFVRICQLAIADCGVSAAELTLHLSIQINTGVPQVLSTTVVETVRSLSDRNRDHTESSASGGCEASEKSQHVSDNNSSCCRDENDLFDVDRSYGSSVHTDDAESWDFNRTVAARSLLSSCATESTFAAAAEGQFVSSPVVANDVHNLILSEDRRGEVPLNEFLADVEKSNDCDEYVISDSPVALLDIGKNKQEANKLYGNRHESLSTPGSSEDSLVAVSGACILSSMQHIGPHYADDLYSSNRQCNIGNTSFLQHCHFGEQDTMQSNSAVCGLTEVVRNTPAVDELSGSDATEIEAENSSLYSNTLDRSDRNDTSYEEDLIVDETDTHSDHTAATESSISRLCSPVSGHPACSEAAAVVKDVSHLKPYTATHLLSTVGTAQQPNVLSIGPNSYRLINLTADTQETEFQKIFSSLPTNIVAAIQDGNQGKCHCDHIRNFRHEPDTCYISNSYTI